MYGIREFTGMWMEYPDPSNVLHKAFGKHVMPDMKDYQREWIQNTFHNTCCVRLSYAMNHTVGERISQLDISGAGLTSSDYVTGKNGKYIFNVPNMSLLLNNKYGKADYFWNGDYRLLDKFGEDIINENGIIIFHAPGYGLNGHVDLWEKGKVKTFNMFDSCDSMEFWKVSS